jgi:hypothetical protein
MFPKSVFLSGDLIFRTSMENELAKLMELEDDKTEGKVNEGVATRYLGPYSKY